MALEFSNFRSSNLYSENSLNEATYANVRSCYSIPGDSRKYVFGEFLIFCMSLGKRMI